MNLSNLGYSFRDPAGHLLQLDQRVLRLVKTNHAPDVNRFLSTETSHRLFGTGTLVGTDVVPLETVLSDLRARGFDLQDAGEYGLALEHERIDFASFPAEWPPEMLAAAGMLTLELAEALLDEGYGLKDATPYNVLFRGTDPVFVDLLSFERRKEGDATWLAHAQFVRTFLLPLFVNSRFGLPLDNCFLSRRDGIEPEQVYGMAGPLQRWLPPFLHLVSIPVWLGKQRGDNTSIYRPRLLQEREKAAFILSSLFARLKNHLSRLQPSAGRSSVWSDYVDNNSYSDQQFAAKSAFVESALRDNPPRKLLDIGCNTGFFSALAARGGASVVAIDSDPVVVGKLWRSARQERLDVLPLVVNLCRPTPGLGWKNGETPSFLQRASGRFDMVLMLAVLHHMLVTEQIPLAEIIDLAAAITRQFLIIEYVAPQDPMFVRLTRGREHLYSQLTRERFEAECLRHFSIMQSCHLENTSRWLYLLRRRGR